MSLRREYCAPILVERPDVDWFEIVSEAYTDPRADGWEALERIRARYPVALHGTGLAVGSSAPADAGYLNRLQALIRTLQPSWVSDHLCQVARGRDGNALLQAIPYTEEKLNQVVSRVAAVQELLERPLLLENIPGQQPANGAQMPEWEFIAEVATRSDSLILLDLDNLYLSSVRQAFDPDRFLAALPANRVQEIHLGTRNRCSEFLPDTQPGRQPVWNLYAKAVQRFGPVNTLIEPTSEIPTLREMLRELEDARATLRGTLERQPLDG